MLRQQEEDIICNILSSLLLDIEVYPVKEVREKYKLNKASCSK